MYRDPIQTYQETRVLTADGMGLVRILYEEAIRSVESARIHLNSGDALARSKSVTKAVNILSELTLSLNDEAAPEISANLRALYDYLQLQLLNAHVSQSDALLAEVAGVLNTVSEAWNAVPDQSL